MFLNFLQPHDLAISLIRHCIADYLLSCLVYNTIDIALSYKITSSPFVTTTIVAPDQVRESSSLPLTYTINYNNLLSNYLGALLVSAFTFNYPSLSGTFVDF